MWVWLAMRLAPFVGGLLLVALIVASILGVIAHEITELEDASQWFMLPLARRKTPERDMSEGLSLRRGRIGRQR